MIGKLRGAVDTVGAELAIIDVGGVGYEVACSSRTLSALPAPGEPVTLSIDTHVRQDAIKLYGFLTETERGWFRLLQSVQGVGSKVALAILSTLDTTQLAHAIALQDRAMVARAPGVGPKVALRIVNELKDKVPPAAISATGVVTAIAPPSGAAGPGGASPVTEAVSALLNLGYAQAQANAAVAAALQKAGDPPRTENLIRLALKELAR
jgi:holliday junction DNA helicase RuvA